MIDTKKLARWTNEINASAQGRDIALRLHDIYEHSIVPEVMVSMQQELSPTSYERTSRRIPDVNTIRMITNKLSKVYDKDAVRDTEKKRDKQLIEYYEREMQVDKKMRTANTLLELAKGCALEPYMSPTGPRLRVLTNYQCQPHSDDPDDPTRMTAFTKFMPDEQVEFKDQFGKTLKKTIRVYQTYTDKEWVEWSSEQGIRNRGRHDLGRIPFVWVNASDFEIFPMPPISDIQSAVLIPKTYADLYYALKFSCHSITVTMDCILPQDAAWSPDTVIEAESVEGAKGSIENIKPQADIAQALELIKDTFYAVLDSKGITPPQQNQRLERPNAAAALINQADSSSHIKKRVSFFQSVEQDLWHLIAVLHNQMWSMGEYQDLLPSRSSMSEDMLIDIQFGEVKPVEVRRELLERLKAQMDLGLMTKRQALRELYPTLTERQLDNWMSEIDKEDESDASQPAQLPDPNAAVADRGEDNPLDPGQDGPGDRPERPPV